MLKSPPKIIFSLGSKSFEILRKNWGRSWGLFGLYIFISWTCVLSFWMLAPSILPSLSVRDLRMLMLLFLENRMATPHLKLEPELHRVLPCHSSDHFLIILGSE